MTFAHGHDPLFAAMQHDACDGSRTGLSSDAAGTAALTLSRHGCWAASFQKSPLAAAHFQA
jgi:hypothetical protein